MKTCLVVDDSRVIRKVARRILEDLGFSVSEAADGLEALTACRAFLPDSVLLDWNMPVMSGIEFLRQLRQEFVDGRPTVIFCTTENDLEHIAEAMRAGADEYIMKPFDGDILQSKLIETGLLSQEAA
jgi:two-component system, chemotaxis family, chemotaxis protein CheY